MIVLRLLAVFIFSALLTGCATIDDLRRDFSAVTIYLSGLYAPQECHPLGQHVSSHPCIYQAEVMGNTEAAKGRYQLRITRDVFIQSITQCQQTMKDIRDEYSTLRRKCPEKADDLNDFYPNMNFVYTVDVDMDPKNPQDLKKGGVYWFHSVTNSNHITPFGTKLPPDQETGIPF